MQPFKETEHVLLGARGLGHSRFSVFRACDLSKNTGTCRLLLRLARMFLQM